MTTYSASQIYGALRQGGFTPNQAVTFTAIALSESGGSSKAMSHQDAYGVFQIHLPSHRNGTIARLSGIPGSNRAGQKAWLEKLSNQVKITLAISNNGSDISPWMVTHRGDRNFYGDKRNLANRAAESFGESPSGYWGGTSGYGDNRGPAKGTDPGFQGGQGSSGGGDPNAPTVHFDPNGIAFPVMGLSVESITGKIGDSRGGGSRKHQGIDVPASRGTPVVSTVSGTLVYAERRNADGTGSGIAVTIKDEAGNHHHYAHLDQTSFSLWQNWTPGKEIQAGQIIGYVGNSGNAIGSSPHLHYSINEGRGNLIDPFFFLQDGNAVTIDSDDGTFGPGVELEDGGIMTDEGIMKDRSELSVQEALDVARAEFPHLAGYLEIPGVSDILAQAVREDREAGWVQAKIQETEWWKKTDENRRLLTALKVQDPAEYERRVREYALDLFNMTSQMGGTLDRMFRGETPETMGEGSKLWQMAEDYLLAGLEGKALERAIAYSIDFTPDVGGDLGSTMNDLDTVARSYFMQMDDETLFGWARRMLAGEADAENFIGDLEAQAKRTFSYDEQIVDQIDRGLTLTEIFSSHINAIATSFETDPQLVDMSDPRYSIVFDSIDSDGKRRAMTSVEARRWARTQDESLNTIGMRNEASQMAQAITATMGRGSFGSDRVL